MTPTQFLDLELEKYKSSTFGAQSVEANIRVIIFIIY